MIKSSDVSDEEIKNMPLTHCFAEIRRCQQLCLESQRTTFCGSFREFCHAHEIYERVQKENPVENQKKLILEMRELAANIDDDLFRRCSNYADKITEWNQY